MEDEKQTPYNTPYQPPVSPPAPPAPPTATAVETVPQPMPQAQPIAAPLPTQPLATQPLPVTPANHTSPGNIVLQWLTYALWGWTILVTSFLTATVLASFMGESNPGEFTAYVVAAVLVLLPLSIVCDLFYTKQEPLQKHGAASIVMVIHAVIFALLGIGALIAAVFSIVSMFISSGDSTGAQITLYSSIIITLLYASILIRTVFPAKFPWIRRVFIMGMVTVVGITALLGVIGPVAKARLTRTDTLIEYNINSLQTAIEDYAVENNELPADLSDISVNGDAKKLVDDNLVEYKANTRSASTQTDNYSSYAEDPYSDNSTYKTYYYQLCVNYKASKKDSGYSSSYDKGADGYSTYVSAYGHPEGEVCYKLKTRGY